MQRQLAPPPKTDTIGRDMRIHTRHSRTRNPLTIIGLLLLVWLVLLLAASTSTASAQEVVPVGDKTLSDLRTTPRHIGYGISVGPHLDSDSALLNSLGMDWVKLYDTAQIPDFPNHNILYRVDVRGYPDNPAEWQNGLLDLARELDRAGVDAVEVGNEANLIGEWGGQQPNPAQFTDALCRAYSSFKQAAPRIVIVAGGLAPTDTQPSGNVINDLDFARAMLNNGAGRCFDAWAYHPYGFDQPPEQSPSVKPFSYRRTELMRNLLVSYGIRKQIWITEFGWVRDPGEEGLECSTDPAFQLFNWMKFSAETQAAYTVRAFQYADANWPWVGPMFLWNLNWNLYQPDYETPCSHLRWYGILDSAGNPLPVYNAVRRMPKYPPLEYRPSIGVVTDNLTQSVEAGCGTRVRLGSFELFNSGYPGSLSAEIEPVNGPGSPRVWASDVTASPGEEIDVFVDSRNLYPGLHMVALNLESDRGRTMSSETVQGWLYVQPPTTAECIERYNALVLSATEQ